MRQNLRKIKYLWQKRQSLLALLKQNSRKIVPIKKKKKFTGTCITKTEFKENQVQIAKKTKFTGVTIRKKQIPIPNRRVNSKPIREIGSGNHATNCQNTVTTSSCKTM